MEQISNKEVLRMEKVAEGKVRDIYEVSPEKLLLVATDRVSAFDVVMPNIVPSKGTILTGMSKFWLDFTKDIIPNHMLEDKVDAIVDIINESKYNCMLVKKLNMLPIECIVRGYISGSGWKSYKKTGKVCGIKLPEGLKESEKLPTPIYTPTTKEKTGHDKPITFEETEDMIGKDMASLVREKSIEIYQKAEEYAFRQGIIIADTKFEFGLDEEGKLVLADEVLTPDSSRFWNASTYEEGREQESFDKQYLRDWLTKNGKAGVSPAPVVPDSVIIATLSKYIKAYEMITRGSLKLTVND